LEFYAEWGLKHKLLTDQLEMGFDRPSLLIYDKPLAEPVEAC
jgi:hypothetical protein